jgi:aminoglycoside phosphotransferase (APT) family kinase protein
VTAGPGPAPAARLLVYVRCVTRALGEVVARGTRSSVHAYGAGAVAKVPVAATPEGWILAEARYADAARAAGAPVPRLLAVEAIGGRTASIWERVGGDSLWQRIVDRPGRAAALGRLLADVQRDLFALVPPVTLPRQRDRIVSKIRRTAASVDASMGRALELLPPEEPGPSRLCHGDLHPSNVLLGADGPMIVDWFDASRGDPVADVARSSLTLLGDGTHPPAHLPGADPAALTTLTGAYLDRLDEHLGLDRELLGRWQAVSAVARIAEGVESAPLLAVWRRFELTLDAPPQAAAS